MQRNPVTSSNIESIGYDEPSSTLEIAFHNGRIYQYFDVPAHIYDGLMGATDSHGRFFNSHVKGCYRYAQVG